MTPRFDGYFRSGLQCSEDWHAGVRMVTDYFEFLKLYENGLWLSKNHWSDDLDFPSYLASVDEQTFSEGLAGRHPHDSDRDDLHRTGTWSQAGDRIMFRFCRLLFRMEEFQRELRIVSAEELISEDRIRFVLVNPRAGRL